MCVERLFEIILFKIVFYFIFFFEFTLWSVLSFFSFSFLRGMLWKRLRKEIAEMAEGREGV